MMVIFIRFLFTNKNTEDVIRGKYLDTDIK